MQQPGYILDRLNAIKQQSPPPDETTPPETRFSCLVVYRKKHCAKELSKEEVNDLFLPSSDGTKDAVIPDGFMSSSISGSSNEYDDRESIVRRFDTLRYKYLMPGYDGNKEKNKFGNPKSFIDLSQSHVKQYVETHSYSKELWDVHFVMRSLCKEEEKGRLSDIQDDLGKERFIMSHFLGSVESYSFRKDARQGGLRNYETWLEQSEVTDGEVMIAMQQWLKGFVELVGGTDVASYLLQDAGKFPYYFDVESRIDEMHQTYDFNDPSKTFSDSVNETRSMILNDIAPSEQDQVESTVEGEVQLSHTPASSSIDTTDSVLENNNRDSTTNDDSFSACVLWMDDNHRLDEWLAYHYYLLKLRYVVINIDPWSRTPWSRSKLLEIVDRWNDHENQYNLNMTIVTMTDSDYKGDYDEWMERLEREEKSNSTDYGRSKTLYHRERQPEFYRHCSLHLMQQNRSW